MPKTSRGSVLTKGLASAAALAGATQAYGTVVFVTPPANIPGNDPANTSQTPINRLIDLDGNGTNDLRISYRSFTVSGYVIQQSFVFGLNGGLTASAPYGSSYYAYKLGGGVTLPGGYAFGQSASYLTMVATNVNGTDYGYWTLGARGFIGFSFHDANGQTDYGYVDLETDAWTGAGTGGVKIFSIAYENSGGPITTPVPEPGTLAALAFGGAGLAAAAYRRRKQA